MCQNLRRPWSDPNRRTSLCGDSLAIPAPGREWPGHRCWARRRLAQHRAGPRRVAGPVARPARLRRELRAGGRPSMVMNGGRQSPSGMTEAALAGFPTGGSGARPSAGHEAEPDEHDCGTREAQRNSGHARHRPRSHVVVMVAPRFGVHSSSPTREQRSNIFRASTATSKMPSVAPTPRATARAAALYRPKRASRACATGQGHMNVGSPVHTVARRVADDVRPVEDADALRALADPTWLAILTALMGETPVGCRADRQGTGDAPG